ncbi:MAG TPA: hypothetical protein VH257_09060 [Chloroflexota bacterium]|nr:hypothetical protein [Chloroflexota bacterium]
MDKEPFSQPSSAAEASGGEQPPLLRGYTCLACGHRSATWAAFRAHRRECPNRPRPPGKGQEGDSGQEPDPAPESAPPGAPGEPAHHTPRD